MFNDFMANYFTSLLLTMLPTVTLFIMTVKCSLYWIFKLPAAIKEWNSLDTDIWIALVYSKNVS